MNRRKIIILFSLLLTMKTIIGQVQPVNCNCYIAFVSNGTINYNSCNTRGCSVGTNSVCDRYSYSYYFLKFRCCDGGAYGSYYGCNCPNSAYSGSHNGAYGPAIGKPEYNYNYTTCTDYGSNARDSTGDVPYGENVATDCCNYCCDRNDPYLTTTVLTSTTTTTTTTATTTTTITTSTTITTPSTSTPIISTTTTTTAKNGGYMTISQISFYMNSLIFVILIVLNRC